MISLPAIPDTAHALLTTPIQLMLSGRTAKFLRLKELPTVSSEPANFLALWRVEMAQGGEGRNSFLVTNAETLFSFIIPRNTHQSFKALAEDFKMRLRFAVLAATPPLDYNPAAITPVKGTQIPKLIGSMNDMVSLIFRSSQPRGSIDGNSLEDQENFLNETPFGAIQMGFPRERFLAALATLPR